MTSEPMHTTSKETMEPELMFHLKKHLNYELLTQMCSSHYTLLLNMFSPLHSATNEGQ